MRSAACEKLRRSTTMQNAASCLVSISNSYPSRERTSRASSAISSPAVHTETLAQRYARLAAESPDQRGVDSALRALDVVFAGLFLLVSLPLSVPIGLLVLATGGRPLFYRGERVGRHGAVFTMLKFRTLKPDAEQRLGPYLGGAVVERPRGEYAGIGRWLRATQLDEIPQLWNVLRGDMSLVGPRPIRPRFF